MMKYNLEPWEHQKKAIEVSLGMKDLALFWEMGTGKTGTAINILRHKYQEYGGLRSTLILGPKIVLQNWKREFAIHSPIQMSKIIVLDGSGKKNVKDFKSACMNLSGKQKIVVVNYEALMNNELFEALKWWSPEFLICDESHRLKSIKSKRSKRVFELSQSARHKYLLTGTPILQSAQDVFQQFKIMDGGETFGSNFYTFRNRWFEDKNAGMPSHKHFPNYQPRPGTYENFAKLLSKKSLRAVKEECLDLPPLIKQRVEIELSTQQRKMYKEMKNEFITFIKDQREDKERAVVAELAITKGLRLQQIVSGFVKTDEGKIINVEKNPRLDALSTLLEELTPGHKVIVWACFKQDYIEIKKVCDKLKIKYAEVHGGIKNKDKQCEAFRKDEDVRVIICNQASAGIGINLVESSYAIYYSRTFSLEQDVQSEARNYRGGSEIHRNVTRIDLVSPGTIDELVLKALDSKQNIADVILDWKL
jgi:SNF2 family DNA or RNA helicase